MIHLRVEVVRGAPDVKPARHALASTQAVGVHMQIKGVRPESFVKQIRCDRCGLLAELGEAEFQEFVSIELKAGYASIFGDGNDVQVDLCQQCLKASLGAWLRVSNAATMTDLLQEQLRRFDPDRHGGEFPTTADVVSPALRSKAADGPGNR